VSSSPIYILHCIRYDDCWVAGVFSSEQAASIAAANQLEPKGRAFGVYVETWTVDGERTASVHHRCPEDERAEPEIQWRAWPRCTLPPQT
jgi:hypothetical protein